MKRFIKMAENDNVATALDMVYKNEQVGIFDKKKQLLSEDIALEDIPFGNKIALSDMPSGEKVLKYGLVIGETTMPITKGYLVHVHNVKSLSVDVPQGIKNEIIRQMNIQVGEGIC